MTKSQLSKKTIEDLKTILDKLQIEIVDIDRLKKNQIIDLILARIQGTAEDKDNQKRSRKKKHETHEKPNQSNIKEDPHDLKEEINKSSNINKSDLEQNGIKNIENTLSITTINNLGNNQKIVTEPTIEVSGILEIIPDGTHGVLRSLELASTNRDTYISISQVKKLKLRKGDFIKGIARYPKDTERYHSLIWVKSVNNIPIEEFKDRPLFEELKPIYPNRQMKLECGKFPIANRIIDLLAPIGFGQRAMIVAPPKAGKTTLLKDIAKGINQNYPEVELFVVLIGERPEEVTDMERSIKGTVFASNFDESPQDQVTVAELSLERAKRLVELGQDVVILMDSLTRLARAYNVALPASGRTLSGGLDPVSLYPSKRFFGAARNFENGASLTIVATALVETGSKMDEVIFEEFKGTGNMEIKLDRNMANKRIFPAIDIKNTGTRNEELLLPANKLEISWRIRRMLDSIDDGPIALIDRMKSTENNEEFINTIHL